MPDPFSHKKITKGPKTKHEPGPKEIGFQDRYGERVVPSFTCENCGQKCGFNYNDVLVHSQDHTQVSGLDIKIQFADHEPVVTFIDTTGKEIQSGP